MLDYAIAETSILDAIPFRTGRDTSSVERGSRQREAALESQLAAALDLLRVSVILTDRRAEILYANCQAKALLREQRWLRVCTGKLSAANPKCALQLRQAIQRCTQGEVDPALRLGIAVPLLRVDERSIAAWVLPIQQTDCEDVRQAAIFVRSAADLFSEEMFASTFRATSAELRVLKLLVSGMSVEEVSAALKLSRNTVSTHVKSLFAKTGTTRQSELLRLAALSVAPASVGEAWTR